MNNEIKHLYPNAVNLVDYSLQDNSDGKGVFIAHWDAIKLGAKPTAEQISAATPAANVAQAQATLNQKHRAYLASTDYFAIREYEGGKPMPANIKELRAAARLEIKP